MGSLAPFRSTEGKTPVVDAPVVKEAIRPAAPPPAASGPRKSSRGKPRARPEPAEGEEPPAKRPALVVSKPIPGKVPQKARPRIRVRLGQEVQEVEPESYDARKRSPLHSALSSAVPPSSAPTSEGAADGAPFTFGALAVSAACEGAADDALQGEQCADSFRQKRSLKGQRPRLH